MTTMSNLAKSLVTTLLVAQSALALVEDRMTANKTCYYCGFENPCPLDFTKHEAGFILDTHFDNKMLCH